LKDLTKGQSAVECFHLKEDNSVAKVIPAIEAQALTELMAMRKVRIIPLQLDAVNNQASIHNPMEKWNDFIVELEAIRLRAEKKRSAEN